MLFCKSSLRYWWVSTERLESIHSGSFTLPLTNPIFTKPVYLEESLRSYGSSTLPSVAGSTLSDIHAVSTRQSRHIFPLLYCYSRYGANLQHGVTVVFFLRERLVSRCRLYTTTSCNRWISVKSLRN